MIMDFFRELAEESFTALKVKGEKLKTSKYCTLSKYSFNGSSSKRLAGDYYTLSYKKTDFGNNALSEDISDLIAKTLSKIVDKKARPLVVGLGNSFVTSDALGSETVNALFEKNRDSKLMLFKPSVYALTKIESADIINGIAKVSRPDVIIAVDTLCCLNTDKLYSTIQITDAGIIPGSGLVNPRTPITKATLGVPVISIGMPLISYSANNLNPDSCVTPKEIDIIVKIASRIIANGIFKSINKE